MVLGWIIGSTVVVSLISLIGLTMFMLKEKLLQKIILLLVSFAAGTLIGAAFFHLIPEAVEESNEITDSLMAVVCGIVAFFFLEKILRWRHCHKGRCPVHSFAYANLIGDGLHNFLDGLTMAVAYLVNIPMGIATTISIIAHEIPQEIGDFGVLVYGGFKPKKALFMNFITALTAVIGGIVGYFVSMEINFSSILLPFAAGGFIYIAASDLIPELHKERDIKTSTILFVAFVIGIALLYILKAILPQ